MLEQELSKGGERAPLVAAVSVFVNRKIQFAGKELGILLNGLAEERFGFFVFSAL